MALQLPGPLTELLYLVGVNWPDVDEDDLKSVAATLRRFSGDMGAHRDGVTQALAAVGVDTDATSYEALVQHWAGVATGPVAQVLHTVEDIAQGLDVVADLVVVCKAAFITQLSMLQAEIAAAEASVFGSVSIPGLIATAKMILQRLLDQLEAEAFSKVTGELFGGLLGDIEGGVDGMVTRTMKGLVHA